MSGVAMEFLTMKDGIAFSGQNREAEGIVPILLRLQICSTVPGESPFHQLAELDALPVLAHNRQCTHLRHLDRILAIRKLPAAKA
jgi:hypothetical protein